MKGYNELKQYQRQHRESFSDNLALRTHRGLSWLQRAEMSDEDAKFIFLWISFNAIYAQELEPTRLSESQRFTQFIGKLLAIDEKNSSNRLSGKNLLAAFASS